MSSNLILVCAFLVSFCSFPTYVFSAEQFSKPAVFAVKERSVPLCFSTLGNFYSMSEVTVSSRVSGFLQSITVKEGQRVARGQLLAEIDDADINAQISAQQAQVKQAELALEDAAIDLNKYKNLYASGSVTESQWRKVKLAHGVAKENLQAAIAGLSSAQAQRKYTKIKSPIAGYVTRVMEEEGNTSKPGAPILMVEGVENVEFRAHLPESFVGKVNIDDSVKLTVSDLSADPLLGRVSRIVPSIAVNTLSYEVFITFDVPVNVLPGMTGRASFLIGEEVKILIDQNWLVTERGLQGVYVIQDNNKSVFRWLRLGKAHPQGVEVEAGLKAGEKLLLASQTDLSVQESMTAVEKANVEGCL